MRHVVNAIVALFLAIPLGVEAHAQAPAVGAIVIDQPWARATPGGAKTGAAYMTVKNNGALVDRLLGATTAVADKIQFHKETRDDGVSRMQEMPSLDVEPGAQITLKPGAMHMMMIGLKQPLKEGQTVPMTLQFERAGSIAVTVSIEKVGAMGPGNIGSMKQTPDRTMKK